MVTTSGACRVRVVRPEETRAEIVLMIGDQASILLDVGNRDDEAPCLSIQGNGVHLLLFPHGWFELGEVRRDDLDRANDLVVDATHWRDVIQGRLKAQQVAKADSARSGEPDSASPGSSRQDQ
ncbi:hypothetical protein [Krasilnikovia sp. M28-CT-15]|uniref:hypothetical protein n=1 Tax=Krasilnikovia sp. M28-CT-15 TaxID=3373540 RepID=UPI0038772B73